MSATDRGYKLRLDWAVAAIDALVDEKVWETESGSVEQEDAQSMAALFRRMVCGR